MSDEKNEPTGLATREPEGGGLSPYPDDGSIALTRDQLADLGIITPIATPQMLRAAFAEKQRLYAAILDENDYIYTVSYTENGRARQNVYTRKADAEKAAAAYGVEVRASPKKSGIVKLATALGITAKRRLVRGLPDDPNANYSYVVYEAEHKRTGATAEGIGWCDMKERGGRISGHDVVATADTRAYNRAILRLSGFGDVSADEIVAGASTEQALPTAADKSVITDVAPALKKPLALPATTDETVLTSSRAWAESFGGRSPAPAPVQSTKEARELRAKARRGDERAARMLGQQGLDWTGPAQDDYMHESFSVEEQAPVTPKDVSRVQEAARQQTGAGASAPPNGDPKPGWDLAGSGDSKNDDKRQGAPPGTTRAAASAGVAAPDPRAEAITTAQAKALSDKLLKTLGSKEKAQAWLKEHAGVDRSVHVKSNQYDTLDQKINEMAASEAAKGGA